eukprot:TRINITY_DN11687_c0_g1_i1.p1 TRINITY_DN11687_c0_g1~~TRINITY_DN11687_c0_g1_i1.p1  ORF type:complete len:191 (+),score=8.20 TRINITY_DN11687_c0_g1_i1:26-574(+)
MEELRQAAFTYYSVSSKKDKEMAQKIFKKMDKDGNGQVSVVEFSKFVEKAGKGKYTEAIFAELDRDQNGYLDFDDAIVFYYIITARAICNKCGLIIKGIYYSCVKCMSRHVKSSQTCDLCPSCYGAGDFKHKHTAFLDNFALLRKKSQSDSLATVLGSELGASVGTVAGELIGSSAVACSIM